MPTANIDPSNILDIAKTFFAGVSAVAASIGVWQRSGSKQEAAKTFDDTFSSARISPDASTAAVQLVKIIPDSVISDLESRADKCWTRFRNVLGGSYLPDEVDEATERVKKCVCEELRRINTLNGDIPDRWRAQWEKYNCSSS